MRLHRLTLQAIGPFPDEHTIDLAALGAGGLFLLEGPTGAGKSTVIDAVVFALYGRPAGTSTSPERLVSSHAAPGVEPFVDLVLETAAGVFRVRRSPEHVRPKQRGTGTTKEPAKVLLWRLSDPDDVGGQPVSTRVGEADAELARVVGLSREQFVQTVVLPQGEFAAFLRAAPDERRPLLQRLFGTDVYQRMQDELAAAARDARRATERARESVVAAISTLVRSARDAVGPEGDVVPGSEPDPGHEVDLLADRLTQLEEMAAEPEPSKVRSLVDDVLGSLRARVAAAEAAEATADERAEGARRAWESARDLAARFAERDALRRERATRAAADGTWEAAARRLAEAARAAEVRPLLDVAQRARATSGRTRTAVDAVLHDVLAGPDADLAEAGVPLGDAALDAATRRGALTSVLALERGLADLERRRDDAAATVAGLVARLAALDATLGERPAQRARLVAHRDELTRTAAGADAAAMRVQAAERTAHEAATAARTTVELAGVAASLLAAVDLAERAVAHEGQVRRARIAGLAAELAAALEPGTSCPVCGSAEHPAPATRDVSAVTSDDVDAAEAARVDAEAAVAALAAQRAALEERRAAALAACVGADPDEAEAALADARAELAAARDAAAALTDVGAEVERHDAATAALESERLADAAALVTARTEHESLAAQLAADVATVTAARDGWRSVEGRAAALEARGATARRLDAAREAAARAAAAAEEADEALGRACAASGFANGDAAGAALLDPAERAHLQAGLDDHRRRTLVLAERLAAPDVADLDTLERPDLAVAQDAHARARDAAAAATRVTERARAHLAAVARDAHVLDAALAAHTQAGRAAAPVTRMASLATAGEGNDRRTTLATYVLLRRFEDVVAAANERLAGMSDGRFALARTDEREGGVNARRTGLGLVVEDHLTGDRRAPRTLSGGETFYVSLCLALGLADVVSAEAGGVDLGTLVIDEGFGSLDPATLDSVMAELVRLRDGGRVVAIVSHVEELKQRITERLEVRRRADGSSTLVVRA